MKGRQHAVQLTVCAEIPCSCERGVTGEKHRTLMFEGLYLSTKHDNAAGLVPCERNQVSRETRGLRTSCSLMRLCLDATLPLPMSWASVTRDSAASSPSLSCPRQDQSTFTIFQIA